jgi:hypothetical protein
MPSEKRKPRDKPAQYNRPVKKQKLQDTPASSAQPIAT